MSSPRRGRQKAGEAVLKERKLRYKAMASIKYHIAQLRDKVRQEPVSVIFAVAGDSPAQTDGKAIKVYGFGPLLDRVLLHLPLDGGDGDVIKYNVQSDGKVENAQSDGTDENAQSDGTDENAQSDGTDENAQSDGKGEEGPSEGLQKFTMTALGLQTKQREASPAKSASEDDQDAACVGSIQGKPKAVDVVCQKAMEHSYNTNFTNERTSVGELCSDVDIVVYTEVVVPSTFSAESITRCNRPSAVIDARSTMNIPDGHSVEQKAAMMAVEDGSSRGQQGEPQGPTKEMHTVNAAKNKQDGELLKDNTAENKQDGNLPDSFSSDSETCHVKVESQHVVPTGLAVEGRLTRPEHRPSVRKRHQRIPGGYKCNICNKAFCHFYRLCDHKRQQHSGLRYACPTCGKLFTQQSNLNIHVRIHTGYKAYRCEVCFKEFTQKGNLEVHLRRHRNERPYICSVCGMTFVASTVLSRHMRTHTREARHKCEICDKTFLERSSLTAHVRFHTGERPYVCQVELCQRAFRTSSELNKHKLVHSSEKNFECEQCQKRFKKPESLKIHQRRHNNAFPYQCELCLRKFNQKYTLRQHLQKIHKLFPPSVTSDD